jgi:small subunit ribosomal protein S17
MNTAVEQKNKRVLTGVVVSDKMNKTVVVKTERTFVQGEFSKIMRTTKKYKVHDENEQAKVGDIVEFFEGRPTSKTKYMYLKQVIKPAATAE